MKEWKLLVVFDYANGEHTMAEYDKLNDIAEKYNKDFDELLSDLAKSLGAESYTIMSSRLLD